MKEISEQEFADMVQQKARGGALPEWPLPESPILKPKTVPLDAVVKVLGTALAARALLWVNTAAAATLFGISMNDPQPMKLVAAGGYSILVYLPMLLWRREV